MTRPMTRARTAADGLRATATGGLHALRTKPWLKPFRNAAPLLLGRAAQGVFALLAAALATRTLGVETFGLFVLITTFRQLVTGITKLRARETLMRHGARALHAGDRAGFQRLLHFSVGLDMVSALVAVAAIWFATAPFAEAIGIPPAHHEPARLFGLCAVFVILTNTPEALLRLLDRFDLVAIQTAVTPMLQAAAALALFLADAGLVAFLAAWFAAIAGSRTWLMAVALREVRRRGVLAGTRPSWRHLAFPGPGVWHFTLVNYAREVVGQVQQHMAVLLAGALLSPAAAGLLRIAQQVGKLPGKPVAKVLVPAIFPELAHATATGKTRRRRKMALRGGLIAAALACVPILVLVLFGKGLITLVFGADFAPAYPVMVGFTVVSLLHVLIFPLQPLLSSAGWAYLLLWTRLAAAAIWAGLVWLLFPIYGLMALPIAEAIAILISGGVKLWAARPYLRGPDARRDGAGAPP